MRGAFSQRMRAMRLNRSSGKGVISGRQKLIVRYFSAAHPIATRLIASWGMIALISLRLDNRKYADF
jgi:hypothetical protein